MLGRANKCVQFHDFHGPLGKIHTENPRPSPPATAPRSMAERIIASARGPCREKEKCKSEYKKATHYNVIAILNSDFVYFFGFANIRAGSNM